jgi:hypothetical protein
MNQSLGLYLPLIHGIRIHLEELEMNKLETDKFARASTEREMIEDYDGPLEYCDGCFIALGSQEKRIYKGRKKFHMHCVARGKV